MTIPARWLPLILKLGVAFMIVAALDPFEGSFVILAAMAAASLAALLGRSEHRAWLYWGLGLAVVGVTALWGLSAAGGFGGDTGRSNLWWLALLPYPVGWMLALVGGIKAWRDGLPRLAVESP